MLKFRIWFVCGLGTDAMVDFTITVRLIPIGLKMLRQRNEIGPLRNVPKPGSESVNSRCARTKAHHETGARRVAEGCLAMGVGHNRAAIRKSVDVRSLHHWVRIHTTNPVVLVIDCDEENIGFVGRVGKDSGQHKNEVGQVTFHDKREREPADWGNPNSL